MLTLLVECVYVCVCVFFSFTDWASFTPSNIRACQSGTTWFAGQKKNEATLRQSSNESIKMNKKNIKAKNDKKKGKQQYHEINSTNKYS